MRVVFYPYLNNLGHTVPGLAIADRLRARGHTVLFRGAGQFADWVRGAGFELRPAFTFDEAYNRAQMRWMRQWSPEVVAAALTSERVALAEDEPNVVVADYRPTLGISARVAGVPLAAILCADWTPYYELPPAVPAVMGMRLPLFAGGSEARFRQGVAQVLSGAGRALRAAYAEYGVPLRGAGDLYDTWQGDLNLLNDLPRLAPLVEQPSNYHYVGPLTWPMAAPPLPALQPGPLVYATLGSSGSTSDWDPHRLLAEAFADWPGPVVLSTGGQPFTAEACPKNLVVLPIVDGAALAARAAVVVCTAGNGTVYQALAAGTPLVCLPRNPNQWYVAQRVQAAGVGELLVDPVDGPPLRAAVERVLHSDAASNAQVFADEIARGRPAEDAATLIEALA